MSFWTDAFWSPGFWTDNFWTGAGAPPATTLVPCSSIGGSILSSVPGTTGGQPVGNGANEESSYSFISDAVVPWSVSGLCVDLWKVGAPTGDITAKIYATDGAGLPTGAALRTSLNTLDIEELGLTWFNRITAGFTFTELNLALNTRYALAIAFSGDASNHLTVHLDLGGSDVGVRGLLNGTWAAQAGDMAFQLKGTAASRGGDDEVQLRLKRRRNHRRALYGR